PLAVDFAPRLPVAPDAHAQVRREQLLGDRACRDARGGLARARSTAAAIVAEAVLAIARVVGVARAGCVLDVGVILALGVRVADQDGDAGARGAALEHAGQDLWLIRFLALRDDLALPRSSACQIRREDLGRQLQPRRGGVCVWTVAL